MFIIINTHILFLFIVIIAQTKSIFGNFYLNLSSNENDIKYEIKNRKNFLIYNHDNLLNLIQKFAYLKLLNVKTEKLDQQEPQVFPINLFRYIYLNGLRPFPLDETNISKNKNFFLLLELINQHVINESNEQKNNNQKKEINKRRIGLKMPNILYKKSDLSTNYDPFSVYKRRIGLILFNLF